MTPFKDNITKSIDNLNKLQEDVDNTINDLQEQVTDLEEQVEEMEDVETKNVTITTNTETTIEPTTGKYALDKVVVTTNVQPTLEEKSVTITSNTTTNITPSSGYDGLSSVAVTTNVGSSVEITDMSELFKSGYRYNEMIDLLNVCRPTTLYQCFYSTFDLTNHIFTTNIKNAIENLNVTNVSTFNGAFREALYLTSIQASLNLTNWDVSGVSNFSNMFKSCGGLVNLNISNWDLSNVTLSNGLSNMFANSYNFTNDSLQSIIHALLTVPNDYSTKTLLHIGIGSDLATTCTTFDDWTTLAANGWTTGY